MLVATCSLAPRLAPGRAEVLPPALPSPPLPFTKGLEEWHCGGRWVCWGGEAVTLEMAEMAQLCVSLQGRSSDLLCIPS